MSEWSQTAWFATVALYQCWLSRFLFSLVVLVNFCCCCCSSSFQWLFFRSVLDSVFMFGCCCYFFLCFIFIWRLFFDGRYRLTYANRLISILISFWDFNLMPIRWIPLWKIDGNSSTSNSNNNNDSGALMPAIKLKKKKEHILLYLVHKVFVYVIWMCLSFQNTNSISNLIH